MLLMSDTSEQILDIAQEFVQLRGFNAFSYADISREIGIKTASIHYHFPSKSELGKSLVVRYKNFFSKALADIDLQGGSAVDKLRAFGDMYFQILQDDKICLCGMLATEIETLTDGMQTEIRDFIAQNENWLARVFREGRNDGSIKSEGNVEIRAKMFHAGVQGAMVTAKAMGSEERFVVIMQELVKSTV